MNCIVTSPIHLKGKRIEPGETVSLSDPDFERLHALNCVVSTEEHEAKLAAAREQAEFDRQVEAELDEVRARVKARMSAEASEPATREKLESELGRVASMLDELADTEGAEASEPATREKLESELGRVASMLDELADTEGAEALKDFARRHELTEGLDLRLGAEKLAAALEESITQIDADLRDQLADLEV